MNEEKFQRQRREAIDAVADACRLKHLALATRKTYCHWTGRFCDWLRMQTENDQVPETPAEKMEGFLTMLAKSNLSASTQNQAFNALLFFYRKVRGEDPGEVSALRAKKPIRMRHAPTRDQVRQLLSAVEDTPAYPYRLILSLIYGCGLRVSEPLNLRLKDIDLDAGRLIIREAKGNKDRMIRIPACLIEPMTLQMDAAKVVWERAMAANVSVKMPHRLAKKYPGRARALPWFWLFPATGACEDPENPTGPQVWWHCLPAGVQKALRKAAAKTGLQGVAAPHHLRHGWATHASDAGANVRDIQEILGHRQLETTMIYIHPQIDRVVSPLETLWLKAG